MTLFEDAKTLDDVIGRLAGYASMCWSPRPSDQVFDGTAAAKACADAVARIEALGYRHIPEPEYDVERDDLWYMQRADAMMAYYGDAPQAALPGEAIAWHLAGRLRQRLAMIDALKELVDSQSPLGEEVNAADLRKALGMPSLEEKYTTKEKE